MPVQDDIQRAIAAAKVANSIASIGNAGMPGAGSALGLASIFAGNTEDIPANLAKYGIQNIGNIGQGVNSLLQHGASALPDFSAIGSNLVNLPGSIASFATELPGTIASSVSSLAPTLAAIGPSLAGGLITGAFGGGLFGLGKHSPYEKRADAIRNMRGNIAANNFQSAIDPRRWGDMGANALSRPMYGQRTGDILQSALNMQLGNFDQRNLDPSYGGQQQWGMGTGEWTPADAFIGSRRGDPMLTALSDKLTNLGYQGSQYLPSGEFVRREPDFDPTNPRSTSTYELLSRGGLAQPDPNMSYGGAGSGIESISDYMNQQQANPWMTDFRRTASALLGPETVVAMPESMPYDFRTARTPGQGSWDAYSGVGAG